jgi:RNA polymerase sigma-70 factor (ECF subfamily)
MELTDGELLERWRGRDSASGEVLFERYYKLMERFFQNKVTDTVADLVQETFTRCVAGRENIRDNEQFRLYIFGVAYNVLKEHLRRRYRGEQALDVDEAPVCDLEPGPITLVDRRREHRKLLEALRALPFDDQVVLELHYWENLTTEQIAEVLGIAAGTARGRLQRARQRLGDAVDRLADSSDDLTTTLACLEDWARECRARVAGADRRP